jgi:ubiquinone/menaquinone biosynthesis C-methylase UbiE
VSVYESYDETSKSYDRTRVPVGSEIILGCLAAHGKALGEMTLLDAGCGTGAYAQAVVGQVARVEALDMSEGMLAAARAKLGQAERQGRIGFHLGSITDLPFDDGSFDAVMLNQVVHHLGDHENPDFPTLARVVGEAARVLRPGGALVMNHCDRDQLRHGYWYAALIPEARAAFARRFAPLEVLRTIVDAVGLVHEGRLVPLDAVCQGPAYFDALGPLDKAWRDGDSIWALASPAELARAQARVRDLDRAGALQDYLAEHDARRPEVGQITFVHARRS